jgi:hypothetical protein
LAVFEDAGCTGNISNFTQPQDNAVCQDFAAAAGTGAYSGPLPAVIASDCNASGGVATVPPAQAGAAGRICGAQLSGAGCDRPGQVCAPSAVPPPFEGKVCVWRDGLHGCPQSYPQQHQLAGDLDDSRGCEACSCGNAAATCTVTTTLYAGAGCVNQLASLPNTTLCVDAGPALSMSIAKMTTGSCPTGGGQPTGNVGLGINPMTVCCAQ